MDSVIEWTKPQQWRVPGHGLPASPRMAGKFELLATYNSECMRGIVHTADYDAKMAELQREFDAYAGERMAHSRQSQPVTKPQA